MKRIILALVLTVFALDARAAEIRRYHESVRALGMGGAFTAVADDENALFYNPAGLAKIEKWSIGVINPYLEINKNTLDFYDDLQDIDTDVTSEVSDLLRSYSGQPIHARVGLEPYFATTNWAVAVVGRADIDLTPHNPTYPELAVDVDASAGIHAGYGRNFGNLGVGIALKYIDSESLKANYEAADIAADDFDQRIEDDMKEDAGFGVDLGMTYKFDTFLEPTLGLAAINLVAPGIDGSDAYKRHFNFGVSAKYKSSWVDVIGAVDLVDFTENLSTDNDYAKRINAGIEAKLPWVVSLRCGLNQGYFTYGVSLDLWVLKLSYAHYYEEIGVSAGDHADERQMVQVSLGW